MQERVPRLFKRVAKLLPKNPFARNVSVLMAGTVSGHLITIVISPILTRLYSPDAIGTFNVFLSLLSIASIIATMQFQLAIPLPESDDEAIDVVTLAFISLIILSSVLFGIQRLQHPLLLEWSRVMSHGWLFVLALFLLGVYEIVSLWATRKEAFRSIAVTRISQSVASAGFQLALFPLQSFGLMIGFVASRLVGVNGLAKGLLASYRNHPPEWRRLWSSLCKYRQFPLFSLPNELLNAAGRNLPTVLLASFFGPAVAGYYALAERVVAVPVVLIGNATAQVLMTAIPEAYRKGYLRALVMSVQGQLLRIYGLPYMVALLVAPEIFAFLFGLDWRVAGQVTQLLVPWLLVRSLSNPLAPVARAAGKLGTGLIFEVVLVVLRVGGLVLGGLMGSPLLTVGLFSAGATIGILLKLVWLLSLSQVSILELVRNNLSYVVHVLGLGGFGFGLKLYASSFTFWGYCVFLTLYAIYSSVNALRSGIRVSEFEQPA